MAGFKFTGLANGSAASDSAAFGQIATAVAAILPTGIALDYVGTTAPSGWILAFGTIGNAASGATNRANADTVTLFTLLWNSMANAEAPVLPAGRGANAAADYAANKTIAVPDLRGRGRWGKDNMGGTAAGRISAPGGTTLGAAYGQETHTHTVTSTGTGSGTTASVESGFANGIVFGAAGGAGNYNDPSHSHTIPSAAVTVSSISVSGTTSAALPTGMVPAMTLNTIIKL